MHEIYHRDTVLERPESGERLVGPATTRAMREVYPAEVTLAIGRIRGGGDPWVEEHRIACNGGTPMNAASILPFRDGKVVHEAISVGEPWEPQAWRARWVEQTG